MDFRSNLSGDVAPVTSVDVPFAGTPIVLAEATLGVSADGTRITVRSGVETPEPASLRYCAQASWRSVYFDQETDE